MSITDIQALIERELPFAREYDFTLESLEYDAVRAVAPFSNRLLRPGGTIAGPVMMGLADFAVYAAILARLGIVKLAVTTSLNINFLTRPSGGDLMANARLIKLGRRLAVGTVDLYVRGEIRLAAHATATYSIPPDHPPAG